MSEDVYADQPAFRFKYKNHEGKITDRAVHPIKVSFTSTSWHPNRQYLMMAYDLDRKEVRSFAMNDIIEIYGTDEDAHA